MINKSHTARGFTLLETLIAILILTTALAGPLLIASKGLQAATLAKSRITAYYLAQDALEYIRYKRDSNKLGNQGWLAGLTSCQGSYCTIDSFGDSINACGATAASCPALLFDTNANGGYFTYISNPNTVPSPYTRSVTITAVGTNNTEANISVIVSWRDNIGLSHQVALQENIFDWQ